MIESQIINKEIVEYIQYFKELCEEKNILAKLFETDKKRYIYDTGTGKVLSCESTEYRVLQNIIDNKIEENICDLLDEIEETVLLSAMKNIKNTVENEDILKQKAGSIDKFHSPLHYDELEEMIDTELEQIILELTETCNLRCGYCIYGDEYNQTREHGSEDMNMEVAKASIDYIAAHGSKNGVAVTFYGGEPLIKFDLIKYCINYAQKTIKDKTLHFSLTTNLVLMNREIAQYFASIENLSITCSIDGPKDIHDAYRKDVNGNGSFERVNSGLKYLVEAFGSSAADKIILSMVYAPPYSHEKLSEIERFFDELEWLPKKINKMITYPSPIRKEDDLSEKIEDSQLVQKYDYSLMDWSEQQYYENLSNSEHDNVDFFTKKIIDDSFIKIHKRRIYHKSNQKYSFNGCCIPGSRRLYITINGDIHLCERIEGDQPVGNIFTGIDIDKIKDKYINEYTLKSIKHCSNCWLVNMCDLCYMDCYKDGEFDIKNKNKQCESARAIGLKGLVFYHKCLEENPKSLEYLNDIVVS